MTRLFALDLSGDRAALHLWDGAGWTPRGTTTGTGAALPRALAALLAQAKGAPLVVVLPEDQIARSLVPEDGLPGAAADGEVALRHDWERAAQGWSIASVPVAVLEETESFIAALGAVPAGCMAAPRADDLQGPAWFGCRDSAVVRQRATDRPAAFGGSPDTDGMADRLSGGGSDKTAGNGTDLGSATEAGPKTDIAQAPLTAAQAAARDRALAAARRDPAHLAPLPEEDTPAPAGRRARHLPSVNLRLMALLGLLALILGGVALRMGSPSGSGAGPGPGTPAALRLADLAVLPDDTAAALPDLSAAPSGNGTVARAPLPRLDGASGAADPTQAAKAETGTTPDPSRGQGPGTLAAVDLPGTPDGRMPEGMAGLATFFTPPQVLSGSPPEPGPDLLTLPGLDPSFRTDALALPAIARPDAVAGAATTLTPPGPPAQVYVVDRDGLIRPSPEGRLSPDGFLVVAGAPPALTRPRPERVDPETVTVLRRADLPEDDPLRRLAPRLRPDSLVERFERDRLGGKTETELAIFAPAPRPASAQEAVAAIVATDPADPADRAPPDTAAAAIGATPQAVALGPHPTPRSAQTLAAFKATAAKTPVESIAATEVQTPRNPSPKAAADRATTTARLDLSEVNLLGTFGSSRSPRALVRLPSGRVINVAVGDRVDGGRVAGIGDGRLNYVKSGRTVTLTMPRG